MDVNELNLNQLLTDVQAALLLRKSPRTLANWRCIGKGPAYIDDGTIRYRLTDVMKWIDDHVVTSTSQAKAKKRIEKEHTAGTSTATGVTEAPLKTTQRIKLVKKVTPTLA